MLVECASAEVAELVATREPTRNLCIRAGEKSLVVKTEAEDQFRKALRRLGYGLPHG